MDPLLSYPVATLTPIVVWPYILQECKSHWQISNNLFLCRAWTIELDKCSDGLVFSGKFCFSEIKSFCRNTLILLKSLTDSSLPAGQTGPPCWFIGLSTRKSSWVHGLVWFLSKIFSQLALWLGIFEIFCSVLPKQNISKISVPWKSSNLQIIFYFGVNTFLLEGKFVTERVSISVIPETQKAKGLGCKCHQLADFTNPLYNFISKVYTCPCVMNPMLNLHLYLEMKSTQRKCGYKAAD